LNRRKRLDGALLLRYDQRVNCGIFFGVSTSSISRFLLLSAFLVMPAVQFSRAQEALRSSLAGERAAEARAYAQRNQFYNLKLGPLQFTFEGGAFGAWNDNISTSEDAESDFLVGPSISAQGVWPISPKNTLQFSVGAAYHKYIEHSELDRFTIRPDTALEFNVFVKDFRINFHDRLSYSLDPIDFGQVSGEAEYGGLENTAGIAVDWDLNKVILTVGYDHFNFVPGTSAAGQEGRSAELFNARGAIELNAALSTGPEISAGFTDYSEMFHNDNRHFSAGWFLDWKASEYVTIRPRGGYVLYAFDSGGAIGNTPDVKSFYAGLGVSHRATQYLSHSLDAGHEVQSGIRSDALELYYARYSLNWQFLRNMALRASAFYEMGSDADAATAEDYDRVGFQVGTGYQLTRNLGLNLTYQFTLKNSDAALRDYRQNVVSLSLNYRFLPRLQ
jgi:opacity protein-like surface antigen